LSPEQSSAPIKLVGRDKDGFLIDSLDRRFPTKMNLVWLFRAVPGLAEQFNREVPGEFFTTDTLDDGTPVAVISCPCGEQPKPPLGGMTECACERFYLNLGKRIRVANTPPAP
jgi:hypothetical protein